MRRASVVLTLLLLAGSASAEDRTWQGVFVGSVAVGLGGGAMFWYGTAQVGHAERALCEGGAYGFQRSDCPLTGTLTQMEVERLNERGERGETLAKIGAGAILAGAGFAAFAFYKGFIAKDANEPAVVVAPSVSRDGAGAALQLRW